MQPSGPCVTEGDDRCICDLVCERPRICRPLAAGPCICQVWFRVGAARFRPVRQLNGPFRPVNQWDEPFGRVRYGSCGGMIWNTRAHGPHAGYTPPTHRLYTAYTPVNATINSVLSPSPNPHAICGHVQHRCYGASYDHKMLGWLGCARSKEHGTKTASTDASAGSARKVEWSTEQRLHLRMHQLGRLGRSKGASRCIG